MTEESGTEFRDAKRTAELHLLNMITRAATAAQARDIAEAFALVRGTLTSQPVRVAK